MHRKGSVVYGAKCLKAGPPVKQEFRGNRSELSPELPSQP